MMQGGDSTNPTQKCKCSPQIVTQPSHFPGQMDPLLSVRMIVVLNAEVWMSEDCTILVGLFLPQVKRDLNLMQL